MMYKVDEHESHGKQIETWDRAGYHFHVVNQRNEEECHNGNCPFKEK